MELLPFRIVDDDILLRLRVTPGARKPGFEGQATDADGRPVLKLRVRAKAQDGSANADVIRAVADLAGRPPSRIEIEHGETSRLKTIRIRGEAETVARRLKEVFP